MSKLLDCFAGRQLWMLPKARKSIVRYPALLRYYSLSCEDAENIKSQLNYKDAKLLTPKNSGPSTGYKGLMLIACGPVMQYKGMSHLSAPYLDNGIAVINMCNNLMDWAFCKPADKKIDRVLGIVSNKLTQSCPFVLKLYCSGAATYLSSIIKQLSQVGCKLDLKGLIFESGPCEFVANDIVQSSIFFKSQNRYPTVLHQLKEIMPFYTLVLLNGARKRRAQEMVASNTMLHSVPQLYVHSATDHCVDLNHLHRFIEKQQQYKADVTVHSFDDASHMLARMKYPVEYDNVLFNFLHTKCKML